MRKYLLTLCFQLLFFLSNPLIATASMVPNSINVQKFNAIGDGITDNFSAISSAIAYSQTNNIPLYFPAGTYYVSKPIYLGNDISIIGEDKSNTSIVFSDNIDLSYNYPNQRGIITFSGNNLLISNISFAYYANTTTPYNRTLQNNSSSTHIGTLFSILKCNSAVIDQCSFEINGILNPSVTCLWLKSETSNITNVHISNSSFANYSKSNIGGCLWISAHDNPKTSLRNFTLINNTFLQTCNDELLAVWGYIATDFNISDNNFIFNGMSNTYNDVLVSFGLPEINSKLTKILFCNNLFNINGTSKMGIKIQNNTENSNILLQNNSLFCSLSPQTDFRCIVASNIGSLLVDNNMFNIENGQVVCCISYDYGGNIELVNNSYNISSARKAVLVNSIHSKYFNNALMKIINCNFTFDVYNPNKSTPTIQYPESGSLIIDNCNINTAKSTIHEIVLQTFKGNSEDTGLFKFQNNSTDCSLILTGSEKYNINSSVYNNTIKSITYRNTK